MWTSTYAAFGDACATAHGMELIGGRWTYPILRELMLGPKRFTELLATVRGITPAVLSGRLRELTEFGLLEPVDAASRPRLYRLTPWAQDLGPILQDIGRWAHGSPVRDVGGGLTPDAMVQALMTVAAPDPHRHAGELELVLRDERVSGAEHPYRVSWGSKGIYAERGAHPGARTTVRCDSSTFAAIAFGGLPLQPNADVTGDQAAVAALLACIPGD